MPVIFMNFIIINHEEIDFIIYKTHIHIKQVLGILGWAEQSGISTYMSHVTQKGPLA